MIRSLEVVIDASSWAPSPAPPELAALVGERQVNILTALIHTALATRPPIRHGFHLSDLWACFRYIPAIATTDELRLREEWSYVDPHQKTILSDELGVGFTTQLIAEALGCTEFIDTLHVINRLEPQNFTLTGRARTGPQKSPDYIARDQNSDYVVLECKGTQSSRAALKRSIARGQEQKTSLKAVAPIRTKHSLVAGLFIPQWEGSETPCLSVSDPSWQELERMLSGQTKPHIDAAITQIALAKQLALCGFIFLPDYLLSTTTDESLELPPSITQEIEEFLGKEFRVVFDYRARLPATREVMRISFSVKPPTSTLDRLIRTSSVSEFLIELSKQELRPWRTRASESFAEVTTPLGFSFRLEVDPPYLHK